MPKKEQIQANQLFSVKEAAKYVKVSTSLIYKLIRKKSIPFTKIESKYLFSKENLDNWLESLTNKQ
jgi:excisionase family DNA binding protein